MNIFAPISTAWKKASLYVSHGVSSNAVRPIAASTDDESRAIFG